MKETANKPQETTHESNIWIKKWSIKLNKQKYFNINFINNNNKYMSIVVKRTQVHVNIDKYLEMILDANCNGKNTQRGKEDCWTSKTRIFIHLTFVFRSTLRVSSVC